MSAHVIAHIIDGRSLAKSVEEELKAQVLELSSKLGRNPGLAVVLVGNNPASRIYVRSKSKRAKNCGIDPTDIELPETITNHELQATLRDLSKDAAIDGILLQLPLPQGLNEYQALSCIAPEKDVDGLHPLNQGLLIRGKPAQRPCTPQGIMELIDKARSDLGEKCDLAGLNAVVVGRSVLVGKPVALMLLERHCTVTMCHSRTKSLEDECKRADILVAAVGRPLFIGANFIKPGSIVIDVGINRLEGGELVGDVNFEEVKEITAAITPVPGGVGPMTISMLLRNTVEAARKKIKN